MWIFPRSGLDLGWQCGGVGRQLYRPDQCTGGLDQWGGRGGGGVAWGLDTDGQTDVPAGLINVVAIAAGDNFNWALRNDGSVVGWGENQDGQINTSVLGNNVLAIATAGSHGLALFKNGTVQALGDPTANLNFPTNGVTNVVAVACGGVPKLVF